MTSPDSKLNEHRLEARTEDALWLMSTAGGGLTVVDAAKRLGLASNTLEKHLDRHAPGWAARLAVARTRERTTAP